MNDWNLWLNSSETITAINLLNQNIKDLKESLFGGYLLNQERADKIAVDYAHAVGVIEGIEEAIRLIENVKQEIESERE